MTARLLISGLALVATVLTLLLSAFPIVSERTLDPAAIEPHVGFAYISRLALGGNRFWKYVGNSGEQTAASNLKLSEDIRALGPPHSITSNIQANGGGAYSHWEQWLIFSSSDGSDPRSNGRRYIVTARSKPTPLTWALMAILDFGALFMLRNRIDHLIRTNTTRLPLAASIATILFALVIALGPPGFINRPVFGGIDLALAGDLVFHALLACTIILFQFVLGIGLSRALLPKRRTRLPELVLAGFPASIALLALESTAVLVLPHGGLFTIVIGLLCIFPLVKWPIGRAQAAEALAGMPALLALSVGFGTWMALMWHGPTATLHGYPLGDQVYYGSGMWSLASDPIGRSNLSLEGETTGYFNMLWPAAGASLLHFFRIDGLLFTAAAAAVSIFSTGIVLRAYLSAQRHRTWTMRDGLLLWVILISSARFPTWLVSSPPVAFTAPLTICIWFWSQRSRYSNVVGYSTAFTALVCSALTKVVTAGTLVPLSLTGIAPRLSRLSLRALVLLGLFGFAASGYALYLVIMFAPSFVAYAAIGPDSFNMLWRAGAPLGSAWPSLAHDVGSVMIAILAFRLTTWANAAAIAIGIILSLAFPFLVVANFICAATAFGLAAISVPERSRGERWLIALVCVLILPGPLMEEPAGRATWFVYAATMASVLFCILTPGSLPLSSPAARLHPRIIVTAAVSICIILVGALAGTMPTPRGDGDIPPAAFDIWKATREKTPRSALVFADQTGNEPGLLKGWNTYATHGQRQIFISDWYNTNVRANPAERARLLKLNDEVLSQQRSPSSVPTRHPFQQFAAVVSLSRDMRPPWRRIYANTEYAIYLWDGP